MKSFTDTTVTLLGPEASSGKGTALPADLIEAGRGRLRLLAGFLAVAFGFDSVIWLGSFAWAWSSGSTAADVGGGSNAFSLITLATVIMSLVVFRAAGNRRVTVSRVHALAVAYEIAICFAAATLTFWQYYIDTGLVPNLTWVPAIVIMFPLILPGPPQRLLATAIASAATAPLALLVLDVSGHVDTGGGDAYVPASVGSAFAVVFASMGARVVYGLGREVARARALGSYQLVERLGSGGMGEVWQARHRLLARPAAIKLIRPSLIRDAGTSGEAQQRFEREAQVIANLRSPHTVHLFDFGVADDGGFYYAMELLEGLDTDALVRRFGPVPPERAIHILKQACHSLSEAESRGLVHRDIKPANVFLCQYGEDCDFVKVLDFGLVKSLEPPEGRDTELTAAHAVHGTPAFMAPEQALGEARIDGRADIYSLGCVGYWLLTEQLVFSADTPTAMLLKHIQEEPAPPSTVTERPIPEALDALILSCLAKDPADRPQSARALARQLEAIGSSEAWTEARCRTWWETHEPEPVEASPGSDL